MEWRLRYKENSERPFPLTHIKFSSSFSSLAYLSWKYSNCVHFHDKTEAWENKLIILLCSLFFFFSLSLSLSLYLYIHPVYWVYFQNIEVIAQAWHYTYVSTLHLSNPNTRKKKNNPVIHALHSASRSQEFFLEDSHYMVLLYSVLQRKRKAYENSNNMCYAVLEFGIPLLFCIKCNHEERWGQEEKYHAGFHKATASTAVLKARIVTLKKLLDKYTKGILKSF